LNAIVKGHNMFENKKGLPVRASSFIPGLL